MKNCMGHFVLVLHHWVLLDSYCRMNSIERSKKIGIGSLQFNFSPVCKVHGKLDYYAVKQLNHIDYIDMDHYYNTAV